MTIEKINEIESKLEDMKCAWEDEPDWRKEMAKDLERIEEMVDNWS